MPGDPNKLARFWKELKRRRVIHVTIVYATASFVIIELVGNVYVTLNLPEWTPALILIILGIGFPIALIFSWIFDVSLGGIEKTKPSKEVNMGEKTATPNFWKTATYVSFAVIIGLLALNIFGNRNQTSIDEKLEKSIAVLPFNNYSGDPDQQYICLGLTEEVINHLYKIKSFDRVASLRSVLVYQDADENVTEIADELGVNYILECSYKKLREQYRFTVLLIEPNSDKQIWQHDYDRQSIEISGIPSDIAMQIADHLKAFLTDPEKQSVQKIPTSNQEAYDKYLLGKQYFRKGPNKRDLITAINFFKESIALDKDFALAYTFLAKSYLNIFWFRFDPSQYPIIESKAAIDAAFRIDPELPEAFIALAEYYYHGFLDYSNALVQLETASGYMPDHPDCSYIKACVYRRMGEWEKAIIEFENAYQGDPRSIWIIGDLAGTYLLTGKYQEALDYLDNGILLFPDHIEFYVQTILTYLMRDGNTVKAREVLKEAAIMNISEATMMKSSYFFTFLLDVYDENYQQALDVLSSTDWEGRDILNCYHPESLIQAMIYDLLSLPEKANAYYDSARIKIEAKLQEFPGDPRILSSLGIAYAGLGNKEKAIRYGKEAVETSSINMDAVRGVHRIQELAWIYLMVEEYDDAFEQLEILLSIPGPYSAPLFKLDPNWKPVWDHPEFIRLTEKYAQ